MLYIYVDDERTYRYKQEDIPTVICRDYISALETIAYCELKKIEFILDLDHDLGEINSGYDICKFIVEIQSKFLKGYRIHTMNPVGRQNMIQLLSHYGYHNWEGNS